MHPLRTKPNPFHPTILSVLTAVALTGFASVATAQDEFRKQLIGSLENFNQAFLRHPGSGGPDGLRAVAMLDPNNQLAVFVTNVPAVDTFRRFEQVWGACEGQRMTPQN